MVSSLVLYAILTLLSYRDRLFSNGRGPGQTGPNNIGASRRETSKTKASLPLLAIVWRSGRDVCSSCSLLVLPPRRVAVMVGLLGPPRAASPRPTIQAPGCRVLDRVLRPPGWPRR